MRITLGLALLLTPNLLANAVGPVQDPANEGSPALVPVFHSPPQPPKYQQHPPAPNDNPPPEHNDNPPSEPKDNPPPAPKSNPPSNPDSGETEGEEPESEIADALTDILDALLSILTLEAAATTTISSAGALPTTEFSEPTEALPCLSVWTLFDSCGSEASVFDTAAATTQSCDASCSAQASSTDAAAVTSQSSCLCYQSQDQGTSSYAPDVFNGYLSSCNDYVQAQTQLAAQDDLAITTAFCTSASNASVSPTPAAGSITPTVTPATSIKPSQTPSSSFTTSAATALSPMMFSGSWYMVWWTVIVLVGSGWAAYS